MISCFPFRYSATRREDSYTLNRKSFCSRYLKIFQMSHTIFRNSKNAQRCIFSLG